MVDWGLAGQVARLAAGSEEPVGPRARPGGGLRASWRRRLAAYTGLAPATPLPPPELVERAQWAELNLDSAAAAARPGRGAARRRAGAHRAARGRAEGRRRRGASAPRSGSCSATSRGACWASTSCRCSAPTRRRGCCWWRRTSHRAAAQLEVDRDVVPDLGLRARADARVPVPGRRLAARPPRRPAAPLPRDGGRPGRRRRSCGARQSRQAGRDLPRGRARRADPDRARSRRSWTRCRRRWRSSRATPST